MVVRVKRETEWNAVGMFFFCDVCSDDCRSMSCAR